MRIRQASLADLPQIIALGRELLSDEDRPGDFHTEAFWRLRVTDPDCCLLVADRNDKVIGYLAGRVLAPKAHLAAELGLLESVVVGGAYHHLGLGRSLVQRGVAWFGDKGVATVRTSVGAVNDKARIFFKKLGFTPQIVQYTLDLPTA